MIPTDQTISRLDRSKPPPGWVAFYSADGPWWRASPEYDAHDGQQYQTRLSAIAAAWVHYEREHDPPGLTTWNEAEGPPGGVWMIGVLGESGHFADYRSQVDARAAAWAWYWRRIDLSRALERFEFYWPASLAWADEQVAEVERWLAEGGILPPAVLRAR